MGQSWHPGSLTPKPAVVEAGMIASRPGCRWRRSGWNDPALRRPWLPSQPPSRPARSRAWAGQPEQRGGSV